MSVLYIFSILIYGKKNRMLSFFTFHCRHTISYHIKCHCSCSCSNQAFWVWEEDTHMTSLWTYIHRKVVKMYLFRTSLWSLRRTYNTFQNNTQSTKQVYGEIIIDPLSLPNIARTYVKSGRTEVIKSNNETTVSLST